MKQRIAILFHSRDQELELARYGISHIAKHWTDDGHEVINLFGTEKFVPADALILHVNLSVVPTEYSDFAEQYPVRRTGTPDDIATSAT